MGAGIAGLFARSGCEVCLVDQDEQRLEQGLTRLRQGQQVLVEGKVVPAPQADAALKRVKLLTNLKIACQQTDLLIEAVTEDMSVKQEMFKQFDTLCPASTILASNTSGLSITQIASATKRPERVAGVHFWNPPHIIALVEVIKGKQTSDFTAQSLMDICRRIGKAPILVKHDVPGFVGNRLQFAVFREALHLLSEGIATAEDIDTAMIKGPGLRYGLFGPLRIADLGGLDVFYAISQYLFSELSSHTSVGNLMADLVEKGKLGAKTGQGFYNYSEEDVSKINTKRDHILLGFTKVLNEHESG
jgi:3-hydroxybutyryl-CoA dehydrogenase